MGKQVDTKSDSNQSVSKYREQDDNEVLIVGCRVRCQSTGSHPLAETLALPNAFFEQGWIRCRRIVQSTRINSFSIGPATMGLITGGSEEGNEQGGHSGSGAFLQHLPTLNFFIGTSLPCPGTFFNCSLLVV